MKEFIRESMPFYFEIFWRDEIEETSQNQSVYHRKLNYDQVILHMLKHFTTRNRSKISSPFSTIVPNGDRNLQCNNW